MGRKKREQQQAAQQVVRVRVPKKDKGELIGIVISALGGARMLVMCSDGKERNCRIPGKYRNRMWVREGNVVIVKPWEIEGDTRGDIIWRYKPIEIGWLKKKGYLTDDLIQE